MGGKKRANKPPPRPRNIVPLEILFDCPFCNHEKSCDVKMDKTRKTAYIKCRQCSADYQTKITQLDEPLDVYNMWIDACEEAN